MEIILIIIGLILIWFGFILLSYERKYLGYVLGVLGGYVFSGGVMLSDEINNPTPMDVYQGKTTLEITYKDGVAVDSVVVFKGKEK